jgi:hypothetical protein
MPFAGSAFQSSATRPALTSRVMSGSSENATISALRPDSTARLCSPDAPYDCLKATFRPSGVAWKALMIFSYAACGVEYATRASSTLPPLASADPAPQAARTGPPSASAATTPIVFVNRPTARTPLCRLV